MAHVIETAANVSDSGALFDALAMRGKLMDLTQESHDAALLPVEEGGVSRAVRAALACRMARICRQPGLAEHYGALLESYGDNADLQHLSAPDTSPGGGDTRLVAMVTYVDLVTSSPKDATKADIEALHEAGIDEADIVRLAGLVAFVNYQLRLTAVLSVMGETQ
ncbi:CMD domain-containing protein [Vreelandella sp. EE22]